MRVSTHGMKYLGRLEFLKPLNDLSRTERARLGELIHGYARDLENGNLTGRPLIDIYVEPDNA